MSPATLPLAGVRVIELGGFAAGPVVGKYLANYGAEVIRIESRTRLDGFRTHYPPFKDNIPGPERAGIFNFFNDGKRSVTLNLKTGSGVELARALVRKADVVVENFTPGTIARLGLGYGLLSSEQPGLIMLSTCNQGQTGPHAQHPGFGSHLTSLSGFTHLLGYEDDAPVLLYGPYVDYVAVGYGTAAVLAALIRRNGTGRGAYIDLAQYEAGLQFLAPTLLEYHVNGHIPGRHGNRHPMAAPHGVFPCRGEDRWCALSVQDDEHWLQLVAVMGSPTWATTAEWTALLGRKANEALLEQRIADWTRRFEREEVVDILRRGGIRAAPVNSIADLFTDPQLQFRHTWRQVDHPVLGPVHVAEPPFMLSDTPPCIRRPAPCLGEDNDYVLGELLGLTSDQIQELAAQGVLN